MMQTTATRTSRTPAKQSEAAFLLRPPTALRHLELPNDREFGFLGLQDTEETPPGTCKAEKTDQKMMMMVPPGCLGLIIVDGALENRVTAVYAPRDPNGDLKFLKDLHGELLGKVPPQVHLLVGAAPATVTDTPAKNIGAVVKAATKLLMDHYGLTRRHADPAMAAGEVEYRIRKELRVPGNCFHCYHAEANELLEVSESLTSIGLLRLLAATPDQQSADGLRVSVFESYDARKMKPMNPEGASESLFVLRQYQAEAIERLRPGNLDKVAQELCIPSEMVWDWREKYRNFCRSKPLTPEQQFVISMEVEAEMRRQGHRP